MTIAACSAFCMQIRVYITISLWGLITVSGPSLNLLRQQTLTIQAYKFTKTHTVHEHIHTHLPGGRAEAVWACFSHSDWTVLTWGCRNKYITTTFKIAVGSTIHHTRKGTTSSYRRSTKHTECQTTYSSAWERKQVGQKSSQISNYEGNGVICSLISGQVVVPALINSSE